MQICVPTKVISQSGAVLAQAQAIRSLGTKAMIVTGASSARRCGALEDVVKALGDTPWVLFDAVEENPSVETVMAGRDKALAEGVDFFIGIGGGSPMDAAKAMALMTANPEAGMDMLYTAGTLPHLPIVCIPTTCGTGSEVTPYAILTRHAQRAKKSIPHRMWPALALLDPKYIRSLPRQTLVNTAVDALSHLLESWLNTNTNDLNRLYTREGLRLWGNFRHRLAGDTLEEGDYTALLHASMAAGMAIAHTGTSLPHGLSYTLTYELGIPHGQAAGLFLGGYVCGYGDRAQAQEAAALLGFRSPEELRQYLKDLLPPAQVSREILTAAADTLLSDPGKLKNYPFPVTEAFLTGLLN